MYSLIPIHRPGVCSAAGSTECYGRSLTDGDRIGYGAYRRYGKYRSGYGGGSGTTYSISYRNRISSTHGRLAVGTDWILLSGAESQGAGPCVVRAVGGEVKTEILSGAG